MKPLSDLIKVLPDAKVEEVGKCEKCNKSKYIIDDVDNGITLCSQCHVEFHKKYGYGHNTKEQFDNFISQNKKSYKH